MGDGSARELFVRSFIRPLEGWIRTLLLENRDTVEIGVAEVLLIEAAALIECPIAGQPIDLSMRGYADDVSHTLPIADNNPVRAAALARTSSSFLSSMLREQGAFAHNAAKEVVLPVFVGPGGYTSARAALSGTISCCPGVPQARAVYLGGVEQLSGGCGAEIRARIDATRSA
eukprot:1634257-Pyramimonas_sp.AAC.1